MVIYNIIGFFKDLKSDYIRIANYDVEYSDLNVITNSLEHKIKNWFKEKFHSIKNRMDSAIYEEEQEDGELEAEEKGLEEETPRAKFIEKLTVADYDIAKVAETGSKEYQKEDRKPKVDKKEFAKKLMENRKALYGESLKESSIDSKLDEIANEDER